MPSSYYELLLSNIFSKEEIQPFLYHNFYIVKPLALRVLPQVKCLEGFVERFVESKTIVTFALITHPPDNDGVVWPKEGFTKGKMSRGVCMSDK